MRTLHRWLLIVGIAISLVPVAVLAFGSSFPQGGKSWPTIERLWQFSTMPATSSYHAVNLLTPVDAPHFQYNSQFTRAVRLSEFLGLNFVVWCLPGLVALLIHRRRRP